MDKAKLESHLDHLKTKHATLDNQIKEGYTKYLSDKHLGKMKQEKLHLKEQIIELETKLKAL